MKKSENENAVGKERFWQASEGFIANEEALQCLLNKQIPGCKKAISMAEIKGLCKNAFLELSPFKGGAKLDSGVRIIRSIKNESGQRGAILGTYYELKLTEKGWWWAVSLEGAKEVKNSVTVMSRVATLFKEAHGSPNGNNGSILMGLIKNQCFDINEPIPGLKEHVGGAGCLSLLSYATSTGHASWVEALLKEGADPNLLGPTGKAPIHYAASASEQVGMVNCLKLLFAAGAKPDLLSATSQSSLDFLKQQDTPAAFFLKGCYEAAREQRKIATSLGVDLKTELVETPLITRKLNSL